MATRTAMPGGVVPTMCGYTCNLIEELPGDMLGGPSPPAGASLSSAGGGPPTLGSDRPNMSHHLVGRVLSSSKRSRPNPQAAVSPPCTRGAQALTSPGAPAWPLARGARRLGSPLAPPPPPPQAARQ